MTQKELRDSIHSLLTWYIDSSSTPLIQLLEEACSISCSGYLKIHDVYTNKTYTFKDAQRILKISKL